MKFPRFIRVPQYKRFHIEPRYYDPIKEEIDFRTKQIERELTNSKLGNYTPNFQGSFKRKVTRGSNVAILRFIIFMVIGGSIFGYSYLGPDFLYIFFLIIPVYAYFRLKRGRKTRP